MKMVSIAAIAAGSLSTRIGIVHMDPEGIDDRAKNNVVPEDVAVRLEKRGLVKIGKTVSTVDTRAGARLGRLAESVVGEAIAERVEETAKDPDDDALITGSDTRDTTAFQENPKAAPTRTAPAEPEALDDASDAPADDDADEGDAGETKTTAAKAGGAANKK